MWMVFEVRAARDDASHSVAISLECRTAEPWTSRVGRERSGSRWMASEEVERRCVALVSPSLSGIPRSISVRSVVAHSHDSRSDEEHAVNASDAPPAAPDGPGRPLIPGAGIVLGPRAPPGALRPAAPVRPDLGAGARRGRLRAR